MTQDNLRDMADTIIEIIDDNESLKMLVSEQSMLIYALVTSNGGEIRREIWDGMSDWFANQRFCPHSHGVTEDGTKVSIKSSPPK